MTTTDKTGAPTTVTQESDRFSISVDGQKVGFTEWDLTSPVGLVAQRARE